MAKGLRMVSVALSGHGVSRGSKANRTVAEDGGGETKTKGRRQGKGLTRGAVGLVARQSNHTQVPNLKEADILMDCPAGARGQNVGKDLEGIRKQKKEPFFGWPYSHLLRWGWGGGGP